MTKFADYRTGYDQAKSLAKARRKSRDMAVEVGIDLSSPNSFYETSSKLDEVQENVFAKTRNEAEKTWYSAKRPFFNVYPCVERKFLQLPGTIDLSELTLPFESIEVRTTSRTVLIHEMLDGFLFYIGTGIDGTFRQLELPKSRTINTSLAEFEATPQPFTPGNESALVFIAAGTCLLARDASIVKPVILNKHRRDDMTPAEVADYAERAISRTGRVGFEVGRDIERNQASTHYRNGCFAKYYVTESHEQYPPNATAAKVPIVKWRCGSVVNADNVPTVPTGFKDQLPAKADTPSGGRG